MTTTSWPIKDQPITHDMWADEFGGQDGIFDDYSGNGFRLVMPGSGDNVTISTTSAKYRLRGFVLNVTADHLLNLPAVATGGTAKTYDIGVKYDSALEADSGGPLAMYVALAGSYSASGSTTAYHKMYAVTRLAGQALASAAVLNSRIWVAGHYSGFSTSLPVFGLPLGARMTVGQVDYIRTRVSDGSGGYSLAWTATNQPAWSDLPMASGLGTFVTNPSYALVSGECVIRGQVQRTSGAQLSSGNVNVTIATLPSGYRPPVTCQFPVACSFAGSNHSGRMTVNTDGTCVFTPDNDGCTWMSFDGIRFFVDLTS